MGESSPGMRADPPAPALPAGWYVDPWRLAPGRWWTGSAWTGDTTGWRRRILLPPISTDGRCRYAAFDGYESAPTPAELWKRWPAEPRPALRWGDGGTSRVVVAAMIVLMLLRPLLAPFLLVFLWKNDRSRAWKEASRPLVLSRPGREGMAGAVAARWWPTTSPITATECVWWETTLERRAGRGPGGWRKCWQLSSILSDFNLTDADGECWVHLSDPRRMRPALLELLRAEFEHKGGRFRIVERGLPLGTEALATGCVVSMSTGELTLADDREAGVAAPMRQWFVPPIPWSLLPASVAERGRRETCVLRALGTGVCLLAVAMAALWPGLLDTSSMSTGWAALPTVVLFVASAAVIALLFHLPGILWQHDRQIDDLVGDLQMSFGLVQSRLLTCRRGLDATEARLGLDEHPGGGGEPSARDSSDEAVSDAAVRPFPDAEQIGQTRRRIEQLDTRWRLLMPRVSGPAGSGDPALEGLVAQQVEAWRLLGLAVGHYRKAVAEAEAVSERGGRMAIRLAVRLPMVPPSLPSVSKWG